MANTRARFLRLALVGLTVGCMNAPTLVAQAKPDNTAVNKGDRASGAVTADQQKNTRPDLETSRQIRRAIMAEKSLSTYAHNVKIVTRDGKVTLRGPVRTEAEKQLVQAKANEVAGAPNVTSLVSVVPEKPGK